jgi:hypothetical protein
VSAPSSTEPAKQETVGIPAEPESPR